MRISSEIFPAALLLALLRLVAGSHGATNNKLRGGGGAEESSWSSSFILDDERSYSFEQFVQDFDRTYENPVEYAVRKQIFNENLRTIVEHNRVQQQHGYWMGINPWADRRADELWMGYDKYQSSNRVVKSSARQQRRGLRELPITMEPVEDLPKSVDWRLKGVTTPIKNQGMCGSCWAFASTAVLESHVAIQTGTLFELSPQELVSCAPNAQRCGGAGGCSGATAEIAFDLVKSSGMVQEWSFGYQDGNGGLVNCTLAEHTMHRGDDPKEYFRGTVASIADYAVLPSNNYTALMNVVAKLGPVTVSVACSPWHLYQSGVFYAPLTPGKATDLNHLVVLEGYGTDQETGEDYWLVRNSWGPLWGEKGYIRLKRVGEQECGMDETPSHGTACTLDPDGNEIKPEPQLICGNSGILFDTAIPLGGYLLR